MLASDRSAPVREEEKVINCFREDTGSSTLNELMVCHKVTVRVSPHTRSTRPRYEFRHTLAQQGHGVSFATHSLNKVTV